MARKTTILTVFLAVLSVVVIGKTPSAGATEVNEGNRTVSTDKLTVRWSQTNPEEIVFLSWNGSSNLTNSWVHPDCAEGGDFEFFGNAFASGILVGWDSTGSWDAAPAGVEISSVSLDCPGSLGVQVRTAYRFSDSPTSDNVRVTRTFDLGAETLPSIVPYMPRLFPQDAFTTVLYPNANGTALQSRLQADCEFGCEVSDWAGTWFAIHNPATGRGMIVQRQASPHDVNLWIDQDNGSFTSATAVQLVAPTGGFKGSVTETETICFYDSARWPDSMQQSLTIPTECQFSGTFIDDNESTFESDIEWLAAEGITKGCNPPTNDLFCPDDFVTRGQMAAFLHRALDDVLTPTTSVEFVDDNGNTFEADIEWLGGTGVTKSCNPPNNDRYCPDDFVTRGQMAAFLVRALGYTDNGGGNLFTDDDGNTFENDIDRLATAGVTKGCNPPNNDQYCPDDFVTRGQMAAFLHRALGS